VSEPVRRGRAVGRFVIGLGVLAVAAVPARRVRPSAVEATMFEAVNTLPEALHTPIWPLMQCGSLAAVPVVAVTLRIAGHDAAAARVAVGGVAAWALAKGAKRVVGRGRPDGLVDAVRLRGDRQSGRGFPSGHAAVSTVLAAGTAAVVPGLGPVLAGIVATVCISRVYVGAHLPLDVIGGAGLGLAVHAAVGIVAPEQRA
jgi:membrane-associated phospholipid phosphatase